MKSFKQIVFLLIALLSTVFSLQAQPCFPDKIITAAYATGGSSPYIDKVLWLTWGSTNQQTFPYGRHQRPLAPGAKSYASIHLGGDSYLCVEAEIVSISGSPVDSYAPGRYKGDSLDKLYNIGGIESNNQLVSGIVTRNNGGSSTLILRAKATINGVPIRISGLVMADAESLAGAERLSATAKGNWSVVDVRRNIGAASYNIKKSNEGNGNQKIWFEGGNDTNTGAVTFLSFNPDAYASESNGYQVEFEAYLKGNGLQALALGLLTPNADLGDAPASYGAPIHLLQNLSITNDGIPVGAPVVNINSNSYAEGKLLPSQGKYLGSTGPDSDNAPRHSKLADGDDLTGDAGPDEEDAWPQQYRRFSYKANYLPGNQIQAVIAYKGGQIGDRISGWIDFDLNGTFDEGERQTADVLVDGNGTVTLTWSVPADRKVRSTYVRLRYFDKSEAAGADNPSSAVNFGEVEDHRMYILGPVITNPTLPSKEDK